MKITIHQAICGEKNKGWDLLATSLDNPTLAKNIAFKTDMQDTPPSGVTWESIIRGFAFNNHYLFIKTFPDNSTDVRKGRVFSHCLIVPIEALKKINDVSPILNLLATEVNKELKPEPIELELNTQEQYNLPNTMVGRFNKVVKGFTKIQQHNNTIIWVGQENYFDAVCRFWQILSQSEREKFNFGINFNVNEIPKDNINLITVPLNSETKFTSAGFCLVSKNDSEILTDFSEQFIAGDIAAKRKLDQFLESVGARNILREEIPMVAKGLKTFEILQEVTDIKKLITFTNIVSNISPEASKGKKIKQQLINRVAEVTETLAQDDLLMLKSLKLDSFENAESQLSTATAEWLNRHLFSKESNAIFDYSELIKLSLRTDTKEKNWFLFTLKSETKKFLVRLNNESVIVFLSWIKKDAELLKLMEKQIDKSSGAETLIIANLPKNFEAWMDELNDFAAKHKLFSLYATILKGKLSFKEALQKLLIVDTDTKHLKGIEIITQGVSAKEIVSMSAQTADSRLITISGVLCNKEPNLLTDVDVSDSSWLNIWTQAILLGNKLEDGIINIQEKISRILDLLINEANINEALMDKISESPYASIFKHPKRNLLWKKLNSKHKLPILNATFTDLVDNLANAGWSNQTTDIKDEILRYENLSYLLKSSSTRNVLWLFNNTPYGIGERQLIDFLNAKSESLSSSDCSALGLIISKGRYESAFNLINGTLIKRNSNLNHTINLTAETFKKYEWDGFFSIPKLKTPKKNYNAQKKTKILFLSANPISTPRLRVDAELNRVDEAFKSSKLRDRFDLENKGSVRLDTFSTLILENNPEIIHFSGHADKQGILLEDKDGQTHVLANNALDAIFKLFKDKVKCVVLNSCYSENQAEIISKHGIYVVGMNDEINDDIAINFSIGFYLGIVNGKDSVFSYNFAKTKILTEHASSASIPVLWYNGKKISEDQNNAKAKEDIVKEKRKQKKQPSKKAKK